MSPVRSLVAASVGSVLALTSIAIPVSAHGKNNGGSHHDESTLRVLTTDLSSPKGLALAGDDFLIVSQGAFGPPGPVLSIPVKGRDKGVPSPETDPLGLVDVAISPVDDTGWGLGGDQHLYHQLADGTIVDVLDIAAYQVGDPDPVDHDDPPFPEESNPYGLTVDDNGDALVADAAGNDVIRVSPDGTAATVARFDLEAVSTDQLPPDFPGPSPLPPTFDAEAVPTTVTIGPDGAIYVGELKGFPFHTGTSHVWRIEPGATDAWCSVNEPDPTGACTVYSSEFTAIQDIAFNMRTGRMYVYELSADGVFAFEAGFESGVFPPATLLEVKKRTHTDKVVELAAGQLSEPGGIVVASNGKIYVTDGMFGVGRVSRVLRDD